MHTHTCLDAEPHKQSSPKWVYQIIRLFTYRWKEQHQTPDYISDEQLHVQYFLWIAKKCRKRHLVSLFSALTILRNVIAFPPYQIFLCAIYGHKLLIVLQLTGGTKVCQLEYRPPILTHLSHDIARFDVPVHHPILPQVVHSLYCICANGRKTKSEKSSNYLQ